MNGLYLEDASKQGDDVRSLNSIKRVYDEDTICMFHSLGNNAGINDIKSHYYHWSFVSR